MTVTSVVVGPEQHGVVRHALLVATAAGARVARRPDVAACLTDPPAGSAVSHWHFTDRLFGQTVDEAAAAFRTATAAVGGRHIVTLHDLPAATSSDRDRRRAAGYRRVVECCHAVVVSSEHERRRLRVADIARDAHVIRLPVVAPAPPPHHAGPTDGRRSVGILGFVYPGKGHADVIAATRTLPADVRVVALGRPSDGHDDLVAVLHDIARVARRELVVTGFLDDGDLAAAIDLVDVPIVPAADMSASASLGTWIAAGRRPLVRANDYTREIAAMDPGLVTLYEPDHLDGALAATVADPSSTRRNAAVPPGLRIDAVAAAHRALYQQVAP